MNADPIARIYRWLEYASFGRALERCRFRFLDDVAEARCALLLGDGDGRFLDRLLKAAPSVAAETIDSSAEMLSLARVRCGADRVRYRRDDARDRSTLRARH